MVLHEFAFNCNHQRYERNLTTYRSTNSLKEQIMEASKGAGGALQVLQTIMLLALVGMMGWTVTTTLDNSKTLAKIEAQAAGRDSEMSRLSTAILHMADQIDRLKDSDVLLERRLTIIETKGK